MEKAFKLLKTFETTAEVTYKMQKNLLLSLHIKKPEDRDRDTKFK